MDIKLINYDIQNHNLYHFIGIKVDKFNMVFRHTIYNTFELVSEP